MYAYVDETGNTGTNLFDQDQPAFITAALMTKTNFDLLQKDVVKEIASKVGTDILHANEIGIEQMNKLSGPLLGLLKRSNARFSISYIEKKYLITTKLVDTLFDSFENKAVPWHIYNLRPMRLLLVFKVASILTKDTARKFWSSILESEKEEAYKLFLESISDLKQNIKLIPDKRSQQIIADAVEWAAENHESIHIHTNSKAARHGHLPNLAAFPNLLEGIEKQSNSWGRNVVEITHDRQAQFQNTLRHWHDLHANAAPGSFIWMMGEKYTVRRVPGSRFRICRSQESPGIQVVDTILWLLKRIIDEKPLERNNTMLMAYVIKRAHHSHLSLSCCRNLAERILH